MNKKPGTSKDAADKLVKNIRRKTRQTCTRRRRRSALFWPALRGEESICFVVSPGGHQLTACIILGRRNSLRLESGVFPATQRVRRPSPEVKELRSEAAWL